MSNSTPILEPRIGLVVSWLDIPPGDGEDRYIIIDSKRLNNGNWLVDLVRVRSQEIFRRFTLVTKVNSGVIVPLAEGEEILFFKATAMPDTLVTRSPS